MIVLDTHIWLWWINNDTSIKANQLEKIEQSTRVGVSAISLFEVSWLDCHHKIQLSCERKEWFEKSLAGSNIELLPITPEIASLAADLPEHHRDPQDRIIIATAIVNNADLISSDGKFKLYEELGEHLVQ
jgi:PIN domain nuclease of toxin-antitoxin system